MIIEFPYYPDETDPANKWPLLKSGSFSAVLDGNYQLEVTACQAGGFPFVSIRNPDGEYITRNLNLIPEETKADYLYNVDGYTLIYNYIRGIFTNEILLS